MGIFKIVVQQIVSTDISLSTLGVLIQLLHLRSKPLRLGIMNVYNLCICHRPTYAGGMLGFVEHR